MIVYEFQGWASSLILLCFPMNIPYIAFIGCPLWLVVTVTWRDVDFFYYYFYFNSVQVFIQEQISCEEQVCWKWSTWILGDWEMMLHCQSSSVSLLITTLALCFCLEAHQHHNKFVSSCRAPDQLLSSSWYWSDKCWAEIQSAITVCRHWLLLNLLSCHGWGRFHWSKYHVIIFIDIDDILYIMFL